jgi:hypothetical protein
VLLAGLASKVISKFLPVLNKVKRSRAIFQNDWDSTSPVEAFEVDMHPLIDKLGIEFTKFSQWVQKVDWVTND